MLDRLLSPAEAQTTSFASWLSFPWACGVREWQGALKTDREGRDRSLEELGRHLHPPVKVLINGCAKSFKQNRR